MADIDFAALTAPVSESEPCGPDLDLAGDPDYMNFFAKAESLLPTSFFTEEGRPFDRASIDFAGELAELQPLLERTRDIRLLAILAKFCILNRNLEGFENAVRAIREWLSGHWDDVHPRSEDGALTIRMAAIETLDDLAPVIFPLQYTPLLRDQRIGEITYRTHMIAAGEVPAREGEDAHDLTSLEGAFDRVELPEIVQMLGRIDVLNTALNDIRELSTERAGFEQAPKLERLPALLEKIKSLLNGIVTRRDPSAALPTDSPAAGSEAFTQASTVTGDIRSLADVAKALSAIAEYFSRYEPSNPALLLVRQAEQLMGKSFFEVIQVLVPNYLEQATIKFGKDQMLPLPLQKLSDFGTSSTPNWTDGNSDGTQSEHHLEAKTRADAFRLLELTSAYYRSAEPSSPLPFLIDRARELAGRDFMSLLKQVLPADAFPKPDG